MSSISSCLALHDCRDLNKHELAEMPLYNLAETVHNNWQQESGGRGKDLYVATVDDFVRAFM